MVRVTVWSSKKHLTQSERYLRPVDDVISDEKVQAKFYTDKKRDRIRKMKIKQDKIIDDRRCQSALFLSLLISWYSVLLMNSIRAATVGKLMDCHLGSVVLLLLSLC